MGGFGGREPAFVFFLFSEVASGGMDTSVPQGPFRSVIQEPHGEQKQLLGLKESKPGLG